ncbi:MAG: helix-turn-helix transcriptional regulator [Candidatus Aminicenantes bacterium]|nr:helix-turn-helix transcriptional regulator [Candidatus Aminicenantes bacterium]
MRKHESAVDIGQRISEVRKKLRLPQKEMAITLQIAPSYLCEIEKGNSNPGPELFVRLASEFNVNMNYLFMGKGDMFSDAPLKIKKQEIDINDDIDTLEKINWLYEKSVVFRGLLISQANKILYQERETIHHNLRKDKSKTDDKKE